MLVVVIVGNRNSHGEGAQVVCDDRQRQAASGCWKSDNRFHGSLLHGSNHGQSDWKIHTSALGIVTTRAYRHLRDQWMLFPFVVGRVAVGYIEALSTNVIYQTLCLPAIIISLHQP